MDPETLDTVLRSRKGFMGSIGEKVENRRRRMMTSCI